MHWATCWRHSAVCRQFFGSIPSSVHIYHISSDDVHPVFLWPSRLSLVAPQFQLYRLTRILESSILTELAKLKWENGNIILTSLPCALWHAGWSIDPFPALTVTDRQTVVQNLVHWTATLSSMKFCRNVYLDNCSKATEFQGHRSKVKVTGPYFRSLYHCEIGQKSMLAR